MVLWMLIVFFSVLAIIEAKSRMAKLKIKMSLMMKERGDG